MTTPDYRPIYSRQLISYYAERYTLSNMLDTVRLFRGLVGNPTEVYEGKARVALFASPIQMGFGDEPQYMVAGTILIPHTDPVTALPILSQVNDSVVVTAHPDPGAIGRTYSVVHVDLGGQFESCTTLSVMTAEASRTATIHPGAF